MRRRRPGRVAGDRVVRPGSAYDALVGRCIERRADDRDGLIERPEALAGPAHRAAHPGDRVPERASPDPELEPTAAHDIERRGGLREHLWGAHRQAGDIREEAQAFGPSEEVRDERERIEEATLVGVVLDADELEPAALRGKDLGDDGRVVVRGRRHRDAEGGSHGAGSIVEHRGACTVAQRGYPSAACPWTPVVGDPQARTSRASEPDERRIGRVRSRSPARASRTGSASPAWSSSSTSSSSSP